VKADKRSDHPALQCIQVTAQDFHWIANKVPKGLAAERKARKKAQVQVRHRMEPVSASLWLEEDGKR
jgi:hypothetical protein